MRLTMGASRVRLAAVVAAVAIGAGARPAAAQGITLQEILDLKRSGVSPRQILRNAQTYCVSFLITDSVAGILRDSVDASLVAPLREACTAGTPLASITPGTLLDVNFAVASSLGDFVSQDQLCSVRFERPGLRFTNRRRQGGCVIGYPGDPLAGEVRIELTVSDLSTRRTNAVMLGFGRTGEQWDHYTYSIDAEQNVELCVNVRDTCRRLLQRAKVAAVATQPGAKNRLEVEIRGRSILLAVNGQHIATHVVPTPAAGGIVLGTGPLSSVLFERLTVRSLVGDQATDK